MTSIRKTKARRTLLVIVLIFLIPVLLAWALYFDHGLLPSSHTNHGLLISPTFRITELDLAPHTRSIGAQDSAHPGKWTLLYFYPGDCDRRCEQGLFDLRQIRLAMGKNSLRIDRALLTYSSHTGARLSTLLEKHFPGTQHYRVNPARFHAVINHHVHAVYATKPGTLYLIDPIGNVIMIYPPKTDPNGVFKDIQLLLRVSQIG